MPKVDSMNWSALTRDESRSVQMVKCMSNVSRVTAGLLNRHELVVVTMLMAFAGCTPPPPPAPAGPAQYHISGKVQPDGDISLGSGVVALLVPANGSIQNVIRENALLAAATSTPYNAWPYVGFQRTMDDF